MSDQTPNLALPYLLPSQAQKHVTHNEALLLLDVLAQIVVEAFEADAPPASPQSGQVWALAAGATGDWAGHGGELAVWLGQAWMFVAPRQGWIAVDRISGTGRVCRATGWEALRGPMDGLDGVGIGTAHDSVNRLAVLSEASLFSHVGAGHQIKLNKASETDTASVLLQGGWQGHAEIGLTGDNNLSVKVSADGAVWTTALRIVAGSGLAEGAAIQQTATDGAEGRLLRLHAGGQGAFGLGASELPVLANLEATNTLVGFYASDESSLGTKPNGVATAAVLVQRAPGGGMHQTAFSTAGPHVRSHDGTAWSAWSQIYGQNSVLGPVSELAGVPTGAVIETGTTANGRYTRWADGTQICTTSMTVTNITTAMGAVFASALVPRPTMAAAFVGAVSYAYAARGGGAAAWVYSDEAQVGLVSATSAAGPFAVDITATGRWF